MIFNADVTKLYVFVSLCFQYGKVGVKEFCKDFGCKVSEKGSQNKIYF